MRFWDYFTVLSFQYESGAILGRARKDKLSILGKMLVLPGTEVGDFVKFMQSQANERLEKFKNESGREPNTFYDFIFCREIERVVGLNLNKIFEEYIHRNKEIIKLLDHKLSLDKAWDGIQVYGGAGIGFGSLFPELTERMYKNASENIDMDEWSQVRKMGVDIPEMPDIVTLEEREESVLGLVAVYVAEFWPELLDPLDLRGYVEEGGK